jgi:DNA polymerase IV
MRQEVARLPGCGAKIAELYGQWRGNGELEEKRLAATDERLSVLKLFYDIWGVGDTTARDFYKKGAPPLSYHTHMSRG